MDRSRALLALADQFDAAAANGDWDRLQQAAAALPVQLERLAAQGPLDEPGRRALARLRAAHERAARACGRALHELGARLDDMHVNKEGRMAYALAGGADPADIGQ